MKKRMFSPLSFLASLGAGGIAVIPFAFFQYTYHTGKGLITFGHIDHFALSTSQNLLFYVLYAVMIGFTILHVILTIHNARGLFEWRNTLEYREFMADPLKNAGIMAPFISIIMTMNVMIGPVRFFLPTLSNNLQSMMLPALIVMTVLWFFVLRTEIRLLKLSFVKSFDVSKIHFGWLLHPFALGMLTVTLTGIAAMSKTPNIAHWAAALSFISGTMAAFLLMVKLISIFKSHFAAEGLPEKQFLPSMLIVVPIITLLAISGFRIGHYLHHQFGFHMEFMEFAIVVGAFAFQTWYLWFGLTMLRDYFGKHFFKNEFSMSQWGLICPFVAYAVLGSFVYKLFVPNAIVYGLILTSAFTAVAMFFFLLQRYVRCLLSQSRPTGVITCYS